MKHYPASRSARLAGLEDSLSRAPQSAAPGTAGVLVFGFVLFLAGLALGLVADAWAALP